jgi:hypothetical protein
VNNSEGHSDAGRLYLEELGCLYLLAAARSCWYLSSSVC